MAGEVPVMPAVEYLCRGDHRKEQSISARLEATIDQYAAG